MENNKTFKLDFDGVEGFLIPLIVELVIATLAVLENFMLILVICVRKNLRNRIFYFILSLSIADFITESVTIYFNIMVGFNFKDLAIFPQI